MAECLSPKEISRKSKKKSKKSGKNNKKDKKQRAKTASRHKIKNVLELTKMVQSGKLKVPKSLLHYIDDHGTLLEQLFTILTQEDIKGMAPDTLKGIKMRHLKQLCLEQLKMMSKDELERAIGGDNTGMTGDGTGMTGDDTGDKPVEVGINTIMQEIPLSPTSDTCIGSSCHDNRQSISDNNGGNITPGDLTLQVGISNEDNVQVGVSNEDMGTFTESDVLMNMSTGGSVGVVRENNVQAGVVRDNNVQVGVADADFNTDMEEWEESVSESARMHEIRLRKKLLQVALKKMDTPTKDKTEGPTKGEIDILTKEVMVPQDSALLELQLRQRALESLLHNRRNVTD